MKSECARERRTPAHFYRDSNRLDYLLTARTVPTGILDVKVEASLAPRAALDHGDQLSFHSFSFVLMFSYALNFSLSFRGGGGLNSLILLRKIRRHLDNIRLPRIAEAAATMPEGDRNAVWTLVPRARNCARSWKLRLLTFSIRVNYK